MNTLENKEYTMKMSEIFTPLRERLLSQHINLSRILPIASITDKEGNIKGFKVYSLDTQETKLLSFGDMMDLALDGINVPGIEFTLNYKGTVDTNEEYTYCELNTIKMCFEKEFYNHIRMPQITADDKLIYAPIGVTAIGVRDNQLIGCNWEGKVGPIPQKEMMFALGMSFNTSRIHIQSLQNI